MAQQSQVGFDFVGMHASMLEIVEDMHLARYSFGCDDLVLLRHVTRSVYFSLVVDLKLNLNALVFYDVLRADRGSCLTRVTNTS